MKRRSFLKFLVVLPFAPKILFLEDSDPIIINRALPLARQKLAQQAVGAEIGSYQGIHFVVMEKWEKNGEFFKGTTWLPEQRKIISEITASQPPYVKFINATDFNALKFGDFDPH